jgi:hypothetical protein
MFTGLDASQNICRSPSKLFGSMSLAPPTTSLSPSATRDGYTPSASTLTGNGNVAIHRAAYARRHLFPGSFPGDQ